MKSTNIHKGWGFAAAHVVATGFLLALSFPPVAVPFLNCVALIPLLRHWQDCDDTRAVYLHSFYAFLLVFFLSFSWPLQHAYSSTAFASLSGVLLIPMVMALPFAAAVPIKRRWGFAWGLVALCSLILVQEAFWSHGPLAMPGALLGNTLAEQPYLNQFADLAGVPGLSLWVLGINLAIMHALGLHRPSGKGLTFKLKPALLTLLLLLAPLAYSAWRLHQSSETSPGTLKALMLQPAPEPEAWTSLNDTPRLQRLIAETDSALTRLPAPDLLIWPETAIPASPATIPQERYWQPVQQWINTTGIPLLSGAISRLPDVSDPSVAFANSGLLFTPHRPPQIYHKNHLVPFAEHVPFESLIQSLSFLRVDAGGVSGYQPGTAQPVLDAGQSRIGVLICFETLFGDYNRRYARDGASVLIALSNIGWWGRSPAPAQYLAFSRLRAIETRRSLILSTVTGPSAIIAPSGRIRLVSSWMQRGAIRIDTPLRTDLTPYARFGDWISVLAIACTLVLTGLHLTGRPVNADSRM